MSGKEFIKERMDDGNEMAEVLKDASQEQQENAILLLKGFNLGVESERKRNNKVGLKKGFNL